MNLDLVLQTLELLRTRTEWIVAVVVPVCLKVFGVNVRRRRHRRRRYRRRRIHRSLLLLLLFISQRQFIFCRIIIFHYFNSRIVFHFNSFELVACS